MYVSNTWFLVGKPFQYQAFVISPLSITMTIGTNPSTSNELKALKKGRAQSYLL
jgi:urea transporter